MSGPIVVLKNPDTEEVKQALVGFSWTTLFFSGFVALMRGDIKWCVIQLVASFSGVSLLIFPFIYNKLFIKELIAKGFKIKSISNGDVDNVEALLGFKLPML